LWVAAEIGLVGAGTRGSAEKRQDLADRACFAWNKNMAGGFAASGE